MTSGQHAIVSNHETRQPSKLSMAPESKLVRRQPKLLLYAALGVAAALSYVAFDVIAEDRIRDGTLTGAFAGLHTLVDKLFPLLAGLALGVLVHYRRARSQLAAQRDRAEALHSSLHKLERDQAVWVLAAAVLHELNNPLHALGLLLDEHAASEGDGARQQSLSERARRQMDQVRSKLQLLRSMRAAGSPELRPVDIERLVAALADDTACLAGSDRIQVRVRGEERLIAYADPTYLRTILENLLDNSLNALQGSGSGSVTFSLERESASAVVRICDTGSPLPADLRASLFEPLRSGKTNGLGLGLPIARALARAMNGELSFEAGDDKAFRLELPLVLSA
jgi:signal transduction histidine kinase